MAYLLRHYPSVKQLNAEGLAIQRLEACSVEKGFTTNTLLAWSSHLTSDPKSNAELERTETQDTTMDSTKHPLFRHQSALIEQLIQVNQKLDTRISIVEAKVNNKQPRTVTAQETREYTNISKPPIKDAVPPLQPA
ncbi:hypothetical protein Pcac1_g17935 [Phytophthora cactorum]|nr:hypothetical protein Pcac1_g17935 [Phytophthora cactorum]KAG3039416.1 hypothetical protein PC119_g2221 [Phytophthora cactorum]